MICKKAHYVLEVVGHLKILHCSKNFLSVLFSILWQKLKAHLNPAYCLDRGFIFLPGHLNLSGEKEDYVTVLTLNSLSPTSRGPLVLCSSCSIFTCLSEELAFFFSFLHSLFIQITFQYLF